MKMRYDKEHSFCSALRTVTCDKQIDIYKIRTIALSRYTETDPNINCNNLIRASALDILYIFVRSRRNSWYLVRRRAPSVRFAIQISPQSVLRCGILAPKTVSLTFFNIFVTYDKSFATRKIPMTSSGRPQQYTPPKFVTFMQRHGSKAKL